MANPEHQEQSPSSLLDALYCAEEQWEEEEEDENEEQLVGNKPSLLPVLLLEQDLFWEDEELITLFSKEKEGSLEEQGTLLDPCLSSIRREKVEWMLKVNLHYGFGALTSVLAVNYFDRFISSFPLQNDKPWMFQLAAVTCVSLAAKVEETRVPLLLDLQVEGTKYVFEAKTIQKMELLVLSTLEWRMNPVTPLSFLDHIIRRLGLKNNLHWEFLRRCERLLLSVLPEWRLVSFVPSVLAAATMMHVIDQIERCDPLEYQNQLLAVLDISKEKVNECYKLLEGIRLSEGSYGGGSSKRSFDEMMNTNNNAAISEEDYNEIPRSPSGVIDASYYLSSGDSSNDSWSATSTAAAGSSTASHIAATSASSSLSSSSSSSLLSVSSSAVMNSSRKKGRMQEQQQTMVPLQLPSLTRVFVVDAVASPH